MEDVIWELEMRTPIADTAASEALLGRWALVYASEDPTRSSPFFWAFRFVCLPTCLPTAAPAAAVQYDPYSKSVQAGGDLGPWALPRNVNFGFLYVLETARSKGILPGTRRWWWWLWCWLLAGKPCSYERSGGEASVLLEAMQRVSLCCRGKQLNLPYRYSMIDVSVLGCCALVLRQVCFAAVCCLYLLTHPREASTTVVRPISRSSPTCSNQIIAEKRRRV